jgi:hypothetical protein
LSDTRRMAETVGWSARCHSCCEIPFALQKPERSRSSNFWDRSVLQFSSPSSPASCDAFLSPQRTNFWDRSSRFLASCLKPRGFPQRLGLIGSGFREVKKLCPNLIVSARSTELFFGLQATTRLERSIRGRRFACGRPKGRRISRIFGLAHQPVGRPSQTYLICETSSAIVRVKDINPPALSQVCRNAWPYSRKTTASDTIF